MLTYFAEDEDERVTYCTSNELAITVHPTDATWECKDAGGLSGVFFLHVFHLLR